MVSRRLGRSLGVDVIPAKTCPLNCIYCEVGRTTRLTLQRKEFVPAREVIREVSNAVEHFPHIDYITFSGSGEPTLNSALGEMISSIKRIISIPVAVLTNGVLLHDREVRAALMDADVVLPSLDAATPVVFRRINRPHPRLNLAEIIDGLIEFRQEYSGKIWLEILFARDVNDSPEEVDRIKEAIGRIKPDRVQIHTVTRPPAERNVEPVSADFLRTVHHRLGEGCEILRSILPLHANGQRSARPRQHQPYQRTQIAEDNDESVC